MSYRLIQVSTVFVFLTALSGCGVFFGDDGMFRDRSDDYLKTESIPPVQLPEGVDPERFSPLYVVPELDKKDFEYPEEFVVPRPQALAANIFAEKVKIQSLSGKRWIAINTSPAEVWPRVRSFLNTNSLAVSQTNPELGLIETTWLQFKDDPKNRDKYKIQIEQGVQPDTAEIHVVHLKMKRDKQVPAIVDWPAVSSDGEREAWMVDELAASLASDATMSSASLLAQTIGGSKKVTVVNKNHEPILQMELIPQRARATLSFALNQEGFKTIEENAEARITYVSYTNPDESEGFFSGWFKGENEGPKHSLKELLDNMSLPRNDENQALFPSEAFEVRGKKLKDVEGFLIIITEQSDSVDVYIRDGHGEKLPSREARDLLSIIRRNLI